MSELLPLHTLHGFLKEALQMQAQGQDMSVATLHNIAFGLLAVAEQQHVANKIAACQVLATTGHQHEARLLLDKIREEYGV